jgi:CheY-like chemotaxis protein
MDNGRQGRYYSVRMSKILFVEDDLMIIRIYRGKFEAEGYEVDVANDGQSALEALKQSTPNLVVLDLQLPKLNGVEVLKYIRSQAATKDLPVIVFSNAFLSNLMQEAREAGATKCLTKADCTPRQLMDVIHKALAATNSLPTQRGGVVAGQKSLSIPTTDALSKLAQEASSWAASVRPEVGSSLDSRGAAAKAAESAQKTQPESVVTFGRGDHADSEAQAMVRKIFLDTCPQSIAMLRSQLVSLGRGDGDKVRQQELASMFRFIHSLTGNAGMAGFKRIAQLSSALEAMIRELEEQPANLTPSCLRTLASAVDLLSTLVQSGPDAASDLAAPALALVVDDDLICARAVSTALDRVGVKSVKVSDPEIALRLLEENRFDLVFLDVEMPKMTGFELAGKLRALPLNERAPVIFVTNLNDFESRARSMVSGGNDLIAKPFMLIELAVKALSYALKSPVKRG